MAIYSIKELVPKKHNKIITLSIIIFLVILINKLNTFPLELKLLNYISYIAFILPILIVIPLIYLVKKN